MNVVTHHRYKATAADRERQVVVAWLAQLPAAGWVGTAGELSAELELIADVLGPAYYLAPTAATAARRLTDLNPADSGWSVTTRRTMPPG